ncbi:LexA family protein [Halopseudomonas pertucinogena]|uniref:Cro/Cl family transcriptional regulator n=1 Tax=Halopseudomonas pertucinogena TaxID=86175 RepID=A0ABQ2CT37_9GAMM|nr:S24 family peptidase [Halopseudomonas pertucinogena]GGJ06324.1 Cro/Cl family transcriptional regulator [Halopseudomonas pertucinogena]
MEYKDRVKAARKHAKLTQAALADAVGIKQASISELETGKSLSSTYNATIAKACGVDPVWLETGRGRMLPSDSNVEPGPDIRGRVPLISWVQAGAWCEVEDLYAVGDAEEWMPCPTSHGPRTYALRVRGESMFNPHERRSFRDGDIIFVDPDKLAENGSPVIAKLDDSQEATFKQLVIEGEERYLKALNPNWPDQIIRINGNATICGVVIGKYEVF